MYELERLARLQDTTQSSIITQAMAVYLYLQKHDPQATKKLQDVIEPNQLQLFKHMKEFKKA